MKKAVDQLTERRGKRHSFIVGLMLVLGLMSSTGGYGQWLQLGLDIDGEAAGDNSGYSVSLSSDGSRLAVGAYGNDDRATDAGHTRVYDWDGTQWVQLGMDIDGEAAGDYSGHWVSLSADGSRLAISARYNDGTASNAGHVQVYDWNGTSWVQLGLDIDGEAANDQSGWSISLSADGSRLAIGARYNDGAGGTASDAGQARVYEWNNTSWVQLGMDIDGEAAGDESGRSVSLSADGSRLAVGAHFNDDSGGNAGHVRVYDWNNTSWVQLGMDINGEAADDLSGRSITLSADGNRLAIGAWGNDDNGLSSGHVRVYEWDGTSWLQLGLDIDGEAAGDDSGTSVTFSANGSRLAIGAYGNDGNGLTSGHVRVYEWDGTSWVQLGLDIDGEAAGDESGRSVSFSADGSRLAIGAPFNDGTASNAGHVRVYEGFIRSGGAAATPLPFMPGWQLLLWGLVLVSLSGLVISRLGRKSI